VFLKAYAY